MAKTEPRGGRNNPRTLSTSCLKTDKNNKGIILLIVLFLIVLLASLILQFQFSMKTERRIAEHRVDALTASYKLRSKVELIKMSLFKDLPLSIPKEDEEEGSEESSQKVTPEEILGIKLYDASSRININHIINKKGKVNQPVKRSIEILLRDIGSDPSIADMIIDFIDPDEKGHHETDESINRPFQNITELALIPGIPSEVLQRESKEDSLRLFDLLTVFSKGKININTAPREVLNAILLNPTNEDAVLNIIEQREIKPFKGVGDIYQIKGVSRGMFGYFEKNLIAKPTVFIAEITVTENRITKNATAVFERGEKGVSLLFYKEE